MLTPAQKATLKAHIDASGDLNVYPNTNDGNATIAGLLNLDAAPTFWAWRTSVSKAEYTQTTSVDGTTFNWTGAGFITRAQGERDAWRELFGEDGTVNPSLSNVRQAFADIFSGGTVPAPANRTHLSTVSRRVATRGERVFATGTGSTATPGFFTLEGTLTRVDVEEARNSG